MSRMDVELAAARAELASGQERRPPVSDTDRVAELLGQLWSLEDGPESTKLLRELARIVASSRL